jgi:1-acyl-sn-glycerol-3-phosphate acyltransferase
MSEPRDPGTDTSAPAPAGAAGRSGSATLLDAGGEAADRPARVTWIYRLAGRLTGAYLWLVGPPEVSGREHVPREGGVLLIANHESFLDIPLIGTSLLHRHVTFVARESLARSRFLAWFLAGCRAILVRRGASDRTALAAMVARLRAGGAVAIFPEGTRSPDGRVHAFLGGAVFAAQRARVPVVPVGISGTREVLPKGRRFPRRARLRITFGPALELDRLGPRGEADEVLRRQVAELAGKPLA